MEQSENSNMHLAPFSQVNHLMEFLWKTANEKRHSPVCSSMCFCIEEIASFASVPEEGVKKFALP